MFQFDCSELRCDFGLLEWNFSARYTFTLYTIYRNTTANTRSRGLISVGNEIISVDFKLTCHCVIIGPSFSTYDYIRVDLMEVSCELRFLVP